MTSPIGRGKTCALTSPPAALAFSTRLSPSSKNGSPALPMAKVNVTGRPTSAATSKTVCSAGS
jgi:hypothetical protein